MGVGGLVRGWAGGEASRDTPDQVGPLGRPRVRMSVSAGHKALTSRGLSCGGQACASRGYVYRADCCARPERTRRHRSTRRHFPDGPSNGRKVPISRSNRASLACERESDAHVRAGAVSCYPAQREKHNRRSVVSIESAGKISAQLVSAERLRASPGPRAARCRRRSRSTSRSACKAAWTAQPGPYRRNAAIRSVSRRRSVPRFAG
jgi:hypothetical protein